MGIRRRRAKRMMEGRGLAAHVLLARFNKGGGSLSAGSYTPNIGSALTFAVTGGTFTETTKLAFAKTASAWNAFGFYHAAGVARAIGRAFIGEITVNPVVNTFFGFWKAAALPTGFNDNAEGCLYYDASGAPAKQLNTGTAYYELFTPAISTTYQIAQVLRSNGDFLCIKGGAYTDWTLVFPNGLGSDALLHAGFTTYPNTAAGTISRFGVADLLSGWGLGGADDYPLATVKLAGARSDGDTFSHSADGLIEFTVTTRPSAGTNDFRFRIQDATNYMQVTVGNTGTITLNEVVAGTPNALGSAATVVSNGHRVVIRFNGANIAVHSGAVGDEERRVNITNATNFQTTTSGELESEGTGGAITGIYVYPHLITGGTRKALVDAFLA